MNKQSGKGLSSEHHKNTGSDATVNKPSEHDAESENQSYQRVLIENIISVKSSTDKHDALTRQALNVYSNNFIENGIRALSITYPTVEAFVGEGSFRILAKKLLQHEPKVSFDWAEYGQLLPELIEDQEALKEYPFLSEVAALDWAIHHSQRAANITFNPTSFSLMETGDTSTLIFMPAPALQIMTCFFPIVELYQLIHDPYLQSQEGVSARQELLENITRSINAVIVNEAHEANEENTAIDNEANTEINTEINNEINNEINSATPRSLVVWRAEYKAQFEYVSKGEAAVMRKVIKRASVNDVIECISEQDINLVEWLTKAISNKFIFAVV